MHNPVYNERERPLVRNNAYFIRLSSEDPSAAQPSGPQSPILPPFPTKVKNNPRKMKCFFSRFAFRLGPLVILIWYTWVPGALCP
jgi:hypothetical protein